MYIFKVFFTLLLILPLAYYARLIISKWVKCINDINREKKRRR